MFNPVGGNISYSDFKSLVRDGKVESCQIASSVIKGTLRAEDLRSDKKQTFVTARVDDPDLVKELEAQGVQYAGNYENTWLQQFLFTWILPIGIFFLIWRFIFKKMGGATGSIMSFGKSKGRVYAQEDLKFSFDDVAGIDEAKEELQEVVEFLKTPHKFTNLGGRIPKGVLLVGAPGTGKTLLAKAVAGEAKVPFFSISGSEFVEMFVGVGASRVRDMFGQASQKAPCIIFIDELDAIGKTRGANPVGGHDEREQTLNQLLVEMDGFGANTGVIIMSATNRPETLDPALLRPGRFDRQVVVDRPDLHGREAILIIHSKGVKLDKNVNLKSIAAMTPGFVGADLANIINEAALLAARRSKEKVGMSDIEEAIERVMAGLEKKKRVINKQEKEIVAYHECGHALVASCLTTTDKVKKISIIPRGVAALGYTLQLPTEDRYMMTKSELTERICVFLGGRIAEEIIFNEVSTGAQNDLEKASEIARRMVKYYGMSDKIGIVTFEPENKSAYLGFGMGGNKEYSEETARDIDIEVKRIIDDTYVKTKKILENKKPMLIRLAKILIENEVIEEDELKKFLDSEKEGKTDETNVN
ncbi:ATP-dependent metalloprotease FtsH [Candidatus Scalindua japonica]|uniref:ATP-dependent zinc metalloprotease FtsH n=2 Tax=Candidatus Scalindua japonica TaxID=1284222 RepID=A0A286TWU8_9BACT|nr:ATP-dependent metalloprotease FtsH [Candidatus Scalindua japonica]